jgi:mannose-6-phosphate isomerase
MFVPITNTPRDYAWGSTTLIAELLGTQPSGGPEAELWLGTHPGSPTRTADGVLADVVQLPYLLKVLAAASPLSLQAHPTIAQAVDGFAREEALGIPLDAPNRNYKDELHKPEIIVALTPFRAMCGFRPADQIAASVGRLLSARPGDPALTAWLERLGGDDTLAPTFQWLLERGDGVDELLEVLVETAPLVDGDHYDLMGELGTAFPTDPGIAISLMLNVVSLQPGEALFLPAGNIHAYIEGLGVELMAASDNVLRGGLTPKHVDVAELLGVLDFSPLPVPRLAAEVVAPGVEAFRPPVDDFQLLHITAPTTVERAGDAILLCTAGEWSLSGQAGGSVVLARGAAMFVSSEESPITVAGDGELFVAMRGHHDA